ncbi:uncharacterized protein LOC124171705 isoform X2 [Ischnura elegans]|nr:uncharacterized protein LOC124165175 isoform X2 [Ischnura elegans]XP_046398428.1 uncharacterized protein LOC124165175 isoform X2 [Ischnura elegans]XP_046406922.1 uncharacterized protein LOC124171705 isoform X2 [Ischnura elegans]XP_046406923.1 uncharacterized protein LOC124171705 isoform X2 [Ischnura elegans]
MAWKIVDFGSMVGSGVCKGKSNDHPRTKATTVVPEKWLFTNEGKFFCYWPPKFCQQVSTLVKKMTQPQKDWEVWRVTHASAETLYDYDFARDVLQGISEVTDVDEFIGKRKEMKYGKGERMRKKKVRDFEDDVVTQARPLLPAIPDDSSEDDMAVQLSQRVSWENDGGSRCGNGGRSTSCHTSARETSYRDAQCQTMALEKCDSNELKELSDKFDKMLSIMQTLDKKMTKICSQEVDKHLGRLCSKVMSLEVSQKEIMEKMKSGFTEVLAEKPSKEAVDLPFNLPFGNYAEFCEGMAVVRQPDIMEKLHQDMSRVGGKDETAIVNAILSKLMTNSFAAQCNWKGQRSGKYMLESSPLLMIVHGGAIRNVGFASITEETVKDRIQKWLKQAGRRRMDVFPDELFYAEEPSVSINENV